MPETFRAVAVVRYGEKAGATAFELAVLPHDERRVRRRLIPLVHGDGVLVDFPEPVTLDSRDCLKLEDGRLVEVIAAEARAGDLVVIMSNGGFDGIHAKLLEALRRG